MYQNWVRGQMEKIDEAMHYDSLALNYYQKIMLLSTLTIAIGIHGLIHLGVEGQYNFNPYNWI